jgi:hypothetical protein
MWISNLDRTDHKRNNSTYLVALISEQKTAKEAKDEEGDL